MNKTNLPLPSLCVFLGLFHRFGPSLSPVFVTTVTTFIRLRRDKVVTVVTKTGDKESPKRWNKPKKTHKDGRGKLVLFISLKKC